MRRGRTLAAAGLLFGLALITACSKGGGGNPSAPNPPGPQELNSGNIGPGGTYQHTFMTAGSFPYHCELHNPMSGTVTVTMGGPSTESVSIVNSTSTGFTPSTVIVGIGGQVTWTNNHVGTTHTVTSD